MKKAVTKKSNTIVNKVLVKRLSKSITFNGNVITVIKVELEHINRGLTKSNSGDKKLKEVKRTTFSLNDVEKFIRMLDCEEIAPTDYEGKSSLFNLKIQCPIEGRFKDWNFLMIFKTFYDEPSMIFTITLYPIKK
jgi:hypothetical protein